jgi:alpha-beta hydrolase superfamily lysophospholipase/thiol-disulfide isomerase/thioredoxin
MIKKKLLPVLAILISLHAPFALGATQQAALPTDFENWSERQRIGDDIPCVSWINPTVKPWAALLCIHGLSLHAANYAGFGKRMSDIGVPTYAIDVRGFGSWQKTQDRENQVVDFTLALDDIRRSLESLRSAHPSLPIVLVGESMGGSLALQAAAKNEALIQGLICSVPASKRTNQKLNTAKTAIGLVTAPNRQFNAGPSIVRAATKNPQLIDAWAEQDKLTRMKLSAKELASFAFFTAKNAAHAQQLQTTPVLFLQGAKDKLIKPQATVSLFQKLATPNKSLYMVDSEHLILEHDQFSEQTIDRIVAWLQENAVPAEAAAVQKVDSTIPPDDLKKAEAHLRIAQGHLLLGENQQAEENLLQVIQLARHSHLAQDAELLLCTLPESEIAPSPKLDSQISAEDLKYITHEEALASPKPSVLMFYADWIQGSHLAREAIEKSLQRFGGRVNFVRIDADAPETQPIIKRYQVRPIPTVIYLTGDNKVAGYTFGFPGERIINAKIKALLAGEKTNP